MLEHYFSMFVMMFVSGILSSMSVWADKISDVRISLNDIYMALLMSVWMVFFMAAWGRDVRTSLVAVAGIVVVLFMIRRQAFIGTKQYAVSMIPHHSMAVFMSKRLLEQPVGSAAAQALAKNIVRTQEEELEILKKIEAA